MIGLDMVLEGRADLLNQDGGDGPVEADKDLLSTEKFPQRDQAGGADGHCFDATRNNGAADSGADRVGFLVGWSIRELFRRNGRKES
jgi:hypothetical protein